MEFNFLFSNEYSNSRPNIFVNDTLFFSRGVMSDSSDPLKIYTNRFSHQNTCVFPFVDPMITNRRETSNFTLPKPEKEPTFIKLNGVLHKNKEFNVKTIKFQQE